MSCCQTLIPVSSTGTCLSLLPSRERGIGGWCCLIVSPALPLWIADQVRNDVGVVAQAVTWHGVCLAL